jgi:hypothetical protein
MTKSNDNHTITGTNINEVKKLNAQSGLTYNEVKILLGKQLSKKRNDS